MIEQADGGFEEFREFADNWRSNSAIRASCAAIHAFSCSFSRANDTTSSANCSYVGLDANPLSRKQRRKRQCHAVEAPDQLQREFGAESSACLVDLT